MGPTNWTPPATGGPGATFEELFGSSPAYDTAILFWAADINNAIAPGSIRTGFALLDGMHGLNDDTLPVVDFSATGILGVGNLVLTPELVPEPGTAALVVTVVCGLALRRRRGV